MLLLKEGGIVAGGTTTPSVHSLLISKHNSNHFIVSNKSSIIYVMTLKGKIIKTLKTKEKMQSDFTSITQSESGDMLYAVNESNKLITFSMDSYASEGQVHLSDAEVVGIARHPFANILACNDDRGVVTLWKA